MCVCVSLCVRGTVCKYLWCMCVCVYLRTRVRRVHVCMCYVCVCVCACCHTRAPPGPEHQQPAPNGFALLETKGRTLVGETGTASGSCRHSLAPTLSCDVGDRKGQET